MICVYDGSSKISCDVDEVRIRDPTVNPTLVVCFSSFLIMWTSEESLPARRRPAGKD